MIENLPAYPEYRDSELPWVGAIPSHWETRRCRFLFREVDERSKTEVDCTLRHRKRLCEAKIYDGPKYHIEGLKQLIIKYATGRERTGYVFDYVKLPNIATKITGIKDEMNACLPCNQVGESTDHPAQWAFTTRHNHRSGVALRVVHFGVNMCWE